MHKLSKQVKTHTQTTNKPSKSSKQLETEKQRDRETPIILRVEGRGSEGGSG